MRLLLLASLFALETALFAQQEWDFTAGELLSWRPENYKSFKVAKGSGFEGVGEKNAYFFSPELQIDAKAFSSVEIELTTENPHVTMYFARLGAPFAAPRGVRENVVPGAKKVRFNMGGNPEWRDKITNLRIDAVTREGGKTTIRAIRFLREAVNAGLILNGGFEQGLDGWKGSAKKLASGVELAPDDVLTSDRSEIALPQPLVWTIEADGAPELEFRFFDIYGRQLPGVTFTASPRTGAVTPPERAASFELDVVNKQKKKLVLRSVAIFASNPPAEEWTAKWIWNEDADMDIGLHALFRREFTVSDLEKVKNATLQITGDDMVECYFNGTRLQGPGYADWADPDLFDVTKLLRYGKNTILCKVVNGSGAGGLLAELTLADAAGQLTAIGTDSIWETAVVRPGEPWLDYFDSAPKNAAAAKVLAAAGGPPWGKIPFAANELGRSRNPQYGVAGAG